MKNLICLLLVAFGIEANAQQYLYFTYEWEIETLDYHPIRYTPSKNVNEINYTVIKKGKVTGSHYKKFNKDGQITEYVKKKGDEVRSKTNISYDEKGKVKSVEYIRKGSLDGRTEYTRNEEGKPLTQLRYDKKGQLKTKDQWTYNEDQCLEERLRYKKDDSNLRFRYVYEYRDECDISKTTLYNGKGKVKTVWTYDCKEEGEVLTKKKNTTQVCKWEESSEGILTKVNQTFDEKGKVIKNVSKFTLKDTLILEYSRYDANNNLLWHSTYDKDFNRPLKQVSYSKKGKVLYSWVHTYQNDMIATRTYYKGDVLQRTSQYSYNDNDLLAEYKYLGKKGEVKRQVLLEYQP